MNVYDIIKKPVVTEKTELLRKEYNKYTFEAVETIFNVKVEDVATINKKPITKRHGMRLYKTQAKKKAVVKLAKENTITYSKEV